MNRKIDLDLHGFTVIQAIRMVEDLLSTYDMKKDSLYIVTGNGDIRTALMDYLDYNNYEWHPDGGNAGALIIFV